MRILEQTNPDKTITELVEIESEDGRLTVMLKSEYDRQQAEQSTPNLTV
jgi:hypothetical protein